MISRRRFLSTTSMVAGSLGLKLTGAGEAEAESLSHATPGMGEPGAKQDENRITLSTGLLEIVYYRRTGKMDIHWRDGHKLLGIVSGADMADGRRLRSTHYPNHQLDLMEGQRQGERGERKFAIRSSGAGLPEIVQHIWLRNKESFFSMQVELDHKASVIGTRHFDVVLIEQDHPVWIGKSAALRLLRVPFDNDMWVRYESMQVDAMTSGEKYSSSAVTAIYDDASRQALVIGAITHDVWKTAIDVQGSKNRLTRFAVYGGISSPTGTRSDTHDTVPHGVVQGARVFSPRVFVGSFADWRDGMEAYGKANAELQPALIWPEGAPMGWNSWAAYGKRIDYARYLGSAAYIRDVLAPRGFERKDVDYINFDAFWSNLSAVKLDDAVGVIKGMYERDEVKVKPGIYWAPFAYFSDDLDAYVEGTDMKYRYRDILLKAPDGSFMPKLDNGRPIDPSHPGAQLRISLYLREFLKQGFTYLKLDFLSHGALEGKHFNPAIQTGIEAYNFGMEQIVRENGGRMFLSLSISPIFPSGYGHSRRISCDTFGRISGKGSTEYMLNSLTYGWWTSGNLYIVDPDCIPLGVKARHGARNITEGESRFLSTIISGGMILDGSPLASDPQARAFAKAIYDNANLFAVASEGKVFRPVEGSTGDEAAKAFVRPSGHGYYLAIFNYQYEKPQTVQLPLDRIVSGWGHASRVAVKDVATGKMLAPARGSLTIRLAPAESKLLELRSEAFH